LFLIVLGVFAFVPLLYSQDSGERALPGPDAHDSPQGLSGKVTGDWFGERSRLKERGVDFDFEYISDSLWNKRRHIRLRPSTSPRQSGQRSRKKNIASERVRCSDSQHDARDRNSPVIRAQDDCSEPSNLVFACGVHGDDETFIFPFKRQIAIGRVHQWP
jgi:hypothetical protein